MLAGALRHRHELLELMEGRHGLGAGAGGDDGEGESGECVARVAHARKTERIWIGVRWFGCLQ